MAWRGRARSAAALLLQHLLFSTHTTRTAAAPVSCANPGDLSPIIKTQEDLAALAATAALSCPGGLEVAATAAWTGEMVVNETINVGAGTKLTFASSTWAPGAPQPSLDDAMPTIAARPYRGSGDLGNGFLFSNTPYFLVGPVSEPIEFDDDQPAATLVLRGLKLMDYGDDIDVSSFRAGVRSEVGVLEVSGCVFLGLYEYSNGAAINVQAERGQYPPQPALQVNSSIFASNV
ncbi:hypothetical protein JKP88DRAFT_315453, partial [Tribonema minus]